jgi:hypothetical protein
MACAAGECDCGWTNNNANCGNNDGSRCWSCCCNSNNGNNNNVNGNNNNGNNNGNGNSNNTGRVILAVVFFVGLIIGGILLFRRYQNKQWPFATEDDQMMPAVAEITEPELPVRPKQNECADSSSPPLGPPPPAVL